MKTYLKDDTVSIKNLSPEMFFASMTIKDALSFFDVDFVITSGSEKETKHRPDSKHYVGDAIDFRSRDLSKSRQKIVRDMIHCKLGAGYDVVIEVDHIHCEWDPKEPKL